MHADFSNAKDFGVKVGPVRLWGRGLTAKRLTVFQAFRRVAERVQGVSLLRIAGRHLAYLETENGKLRLCLGFMWVTAPAW
jgi:hypothetical protein